MGAQIAAHFANAGVPSLLLDLTADVARQGLERARTLKPDPFFTPDRASLIATGGLDADFARLTDADWIIEAVVERLDVKRDLLARLDAVRRPDSIVSSNTSGHPHRRLAEGRSDEFRRHWLGTHFFNPPRYLRLLELIPTPDTDRGRCLRGGGLCGSPARQGHGHREGHAQLHRQPRRALRRHPYARRAAVGPLHHRGDRRHHGAGARASEERDVSHRAISRGSTFSPTSPATLYDRLPEGEREAFRAPPLLERHALARAGSARRRARASTAARRTRDGRVRDPHAGSGDDDLPRQAVRTAGGARRRQAHRGRARARARAVRGPGQGRRVSSRDAGADARLHRARSRRRSPTRSTTSIG